MTSTTPENQLTPVGIIGGGFGALIAYTILRFRGVPAQNIRVFSADNSPGESWLKMVQAIGQKTMRSESTGHFFPTDSPGLATIETLKKKTLKPIIRSWFDRYNPTVESIIEHAHAIARQVSFWNSRVTTRVSRLIKHGDSFLIYNDQQQLVGQVQHVIIAVGHAAPFIPDPVQKFQAQHPNNPCVTGAFTAKQVHPGHPYLVIGDGLSAATEWVRIIEQGGCVIAVSQKGFEFGQPLNTPRRYMSKRGLASYHRRAEQERHSELNTVTRANIPFYPGWKKLFKQALAEGALRLIHGTVTNIHQPSPHLLHVTLARPDQNNCEVVEVDQVIAATGFYPPIQHPLFQQLIKDYNLPTYNDRFLILNNNYCLENLTTPHSIAAVIGHAAAWAIPCADSFNGIKIASRQIADLILGPESWRPRELTYKTKRWLNLIQGKQLA